MQIRVTVFATAADQNEADAVAAAVLKAARAESAFYPTVRLETRTTVQAAYEGDTAETEDAVQGFTDEDTVEDEAALVGEYVTQDEAATGLGALKEKLGF